LNYVVGIPNGRGEVILMAVRNEEVLGILNLSILIEAHTNLSSLLSIILLLLLREINRLHLFNEFVRLLSLFCYQEGSGDNIIEGVTLPMAYTLISSHIICNDKTVRADETEDTCHNPERGSTIVGIHDNDFGASFVRGEGIEEVTVGETNAVLIMNSWTHPCSY
jgi:hypothetical protein